MRKFSVAGRRDFCSGGDDWHRAGAGPAAAPAPAARAEGRTGANTLPPGAIAAAKEILVLKNAAAVYQGAVSPPFRT